MPNTIRYILLTIAAVLVVAVTSGAKDAPYDRLVLREIASTNGQLVDEMSQDFELVDLDGNTHRLSDYRGQVVFLNFWASWCGPCVEEMPAMQRLSREMAGLQKNFVMIAVSQDDAVEDIEAFINRTGLDRDSMLILHDPTGEVAQSYGTELLPETYFIDPDGRIAVRYANQRDWTNASFLSILDRMSVRLWRLE